MYNGNYEVASLVYIYMYMYVQKQYFPLWLLHFWPVFYCIVIILLAATLLYSTGITLLTGILLYSNSTTGQYYIVCHVIWAGSMSCRNLKC